MERMDKDYRDLQFLSVGAMRSCTCMLLMDESNFKVHGTGVFIQIREHYFLVSAAHVLDKHGGFFIPLSKDYEIIRPGGHTILNCTEDRTKDTLDIAVLKLDAHCLPHILRSYNFLHAEDLAIDHIFQPYECYTFLGYPATRAKVLYKTDIFDITTFFHFTAPQREEYYTKFHRHPAVNVITSYNKKAAYDSRNGTYGTGPALHGISGCGLWFTDPSDASSGIIRPKLTAIMTDWPVNNRNIVIGTRIDVVTGMIKKFLDIDFPDSGIVTVS